MKIHERVKRQIILSVVLLATVGGFIVLRYLPLQEEIKQIRCQQTEVSLALAKASLEMEQLKTLQEEQKKLFAHVGDYEEKMPSTRDLGTFLHKTAALMDAQGLQEQLVEPQDEVAGEGFGCIPLGIKCKGRLEQIFNFYKSLQEMGRLVRIEEFTLKNTNNFSGIVEMDTRAVVYYR